MITIRTILCPLDFSDASKNAFRYACEFAKSMGSKIHLLNIVEPRPLIADMMLTYIPIEEELKTDAEEALLPLVQEARSKGIDIEAHVIAGAPVDTILKCLADYDAGILIMGFHGRTGLSRLIMGSVAEGVIRSAHIPVMVVKADEKEFISGD